MHATKRSVTPGIKSRMRYKSMVEEDNQSDKEIDIQDKDEETKEIAAYLALIRKRHDKIKQENLKKKAVLERLKKEYERCTELAQSDTESNITVEKDIQTVNQTLENTGKLYKNELKDRKSYEYVLNRMKKDKIAMELKANSIQISLKSTKYVLQSEEKKSQRIRETQYHSRMILSDMRKTFSQSKRKKVEHLEKIEKELKSREDIADRREDRQKRQIEIAEAAANEDKDSQEVKQRESLLLFKLWYNFLSRKLNCEMKNAVDVERAFSKIKSATGLSDVTEIVEKFLTREQNYFALIHAVTDAERKLTYLKNENIRTKKVLNTLQFEDSKLKIDAKSQIGMEKKLGLGYKNYVNLKEKVKNSLSVYDRLQTWTEKIFLVLGVEKGKVEKGNGDLLEIFENIFVRLKEVVEPIRQHCDGSKIAMQTYGQMKTSEIVAEMSTDEALTKLVRIRLESFCSIEDEAESGHENKEVKGKIGKKLGKVV